MLMITVRSALLLAMLDIRSAAILAGDSPRHPLGDGEALFLIASVANLQKEYLLITLE